MSIDDLPTAPRLTWSPDAARQTAGHGGPARALGVSPGGMPVADLRRRRPRKTSLGHLPAALCPKCESRVSGRLMACPACGLKRAMFGRYRATAAGRVPPALEALWHAVETGWADLDLHERFIEQLSLAGAYAYGAACYRRVARRRPDDEIAAAQLERLMRMVQAVMAVSVVRREDKESGSFPYRGAVAMLVFLVAVGGLGTLYMFHRRSNEAASEAERAPASITIRRGRTLGRDGKPLPAFGGLRAKQPAGDGGDSPGNDPAGTEDEVADTADRGDGPVGDADAEDGDMEIEEK